MCREAGEQPSSVSLEGVPDDVFLCGVDLEHALLEGVVYEFLSYERFCDHGMFFGKGSVWRCFWKGRGALGLCCLEFFSCY